MRMGVPGATIAIVAALTLSACGSSSTSSTARASLSTTTSSTSSTPTTSAHKPAKPHKKHKKAVAKTHKTTSTTTSATTSKTTTPKTTTTTHTTTSHTTTTAAFKPPLVATLTGENHNPKIGTLWSYTVTAKDSAGRPLSGTIETEFAYGGAVVGRESPFKHQFTNGAITNKITFPARAKGVTGLELQVIVITSIGSKTLDWTVSPTTK